MTGLLEALRCGRASWSVAVLYVFLLPLVLGLLPKPAPTAEFLFARDLATVEICSTMDAGKVPIQPMPHRPDCILCATACATAAASASLLPTDMAEPVFVPLTSELPHPKDFALPVLRLFACDLQSRGPPRLA